MTDNKNKKLIFVEGWGGSGKSLLLFYLDTFSSVKSMPVHDKLPYSFCKMQDAEFPKLIDDCRIVRKYLEPTGYYNIEYNSHRKVIPFLASVEKNDVVEIPFELDHGDFESDWRSSMRSQPILDRLSLVNHFYNSFFNNINCMYDKVSKNARYYAVMGDARSIAPLELIQKYHDSKILFVKRPIPDLIAIRSNRKTPSSLTPGMFEKSFLTVMLSGEIQKIIRYENNIAELKHKYPDNILIIDFNDMFEAKTTLLESISQFIGDIKYNELPTVLGYELSASKNSYHEKPNDSANDIFSGKRLRLVKLFEAICRSSNTLNTITLTLLNMVWWSLRLLRYVRNKLYLKQ